MQVRVLPGSEQHCTPHFASELVALRVTGDCSQLRNLIACHRCGVRGQAPAGRGTAQAGTEPKRPTTAMRPPCGCACVRTLRLSPDPGHGPKVAGQSDGAATPALVTSAAALADATRGVDGVAGACELCRSTCFKRSCGLMDKALVFGTKDCRSESCQDQSNTAPLMLPVSW